MNSILKNGFTIILAVILCVLSAKGENPEKPSIPTPLQKERNDPPKDRPRAPSNVRIMFSYDATKGICYFVLPSSVSHIYIDMEEVSSGITYMGEADESDPTWEQKLNAGEYYVRCTADDGAVFSGFVLIELI